MRASYETWPGIKPFVEVGFDERVHDQQFDQSGLDRDSDGRNIKIGTTFELTRWVTGEISFGRLQRDYVSPQLQNLSAPTLDAALTWYATPLTTYKVDIKTTVDESIIAGVSGAVNHSYNFQIDHSFRRWLIFTGKLGYTTSDYEGTEPARFDRTWLASAALTYKMTPRAAPEGRVPARMAGFQCPGRRLQG